MDDYITNNDELPSSIFVDEDFDLWADPFWDNAPSHFTETSEVTCQDVNTVGDDTMLHQYPVLVDPSETAQKPKDLLSTSRWAQLTGSKCSASNQMMSNKSESIQPPLQLLSDPTSTISHIPMDIAEASEPAEILRRRQFTALQVSHLESWLKAHLDCPYPGSDDKIFLAVSTGLDVKQIEAWFSRNRLKMVREARISLTQSIGSNGSLDVLRSSILSDERAQQDPLKRWSDSHLSRQPSEETEQFLSFEQWSGTHFDWWLHHLPQGDLNSLDGIEMEHDLPVTNQHSNIETRTFNLQCTDSTEEKVSNGSQIAASSVPASLSVFEDGAWSGGSSISGFSRISSYSHSSRLKRRGRRPSRRQERSSSVSLTSLSRSNSRAALSQPNVSDAPPNSYYKRRKLARSTTSLVSTWSQGSEQSHASYRRRRGKRLSDLFPALTSTAVPRPDDDFWCTFCHKTFKDAFRWQRHEEAVHVPTNLWICRPVFPEPAGTSAAGSYDPAPYSVATAGCWAKTEQDRTFFRKDAMIQHLSIVHKVDYKSDSLNSIADELCVTPLSGIVDLPCPFCPKMISTRKDMVAHMRDHFTKQTAIWPFKRIDIPKSWSNPVRSAATTLADVEPFVRKGKDPAASHPLQWRCPACPYSTCASPNTPYFHACRQHWFELHDFVREATSSPPTFQPTPNNTVLPDNQMDFDATSIAHAQIYNAEELTSSPLHDNQNSDTDIPMIQLSEMREPSRATQKIRGWRESMMTLVHQSHVVPSQLGMRKRQRAVGK